MEVKEILNALNIPDSKVSFKDNKYVVDLKDSDEYAHVYSVLDNMSNADIIDTGTVMDTDNVQLKYDVGNLSEDVSGPLTAYEVTLSGDLDNNKYKLEIEEK